MFTANGGRGGIPWKTIQPLSTIAIEGHVRNRRRISNVETTWDDQEVIVAVEGPRLTHIGCHSPRHIES
jgi:hypothetical protein